MAKRSMIEREKKRSRVRAKYMQKRMALKAIIADRNVPDEERWDAQIKLQALPRDSSAVRQQRRGFRDAKSVPNDDEATCLRIVCQSDW